MGSSPACHRNVGQLAPEPSDFSSKQHRCESFAKEHFFQSPFVERRIGAQTMRTRVAWPKRIIVIICC